MKSPESDEDVELCNAILDKLSLINIEELSWKDPVASLVLDENSNLIKPLDEISLQQLSVYFFSIVLSFAIFHCT